MSIPASELFWNTATLRTYLNDEWFNKTFDVLSKEAVKTTEVKSLSLADASKEVAPATQDKSALRYRITGTRLTGSFQ